jgi:hypothetical protein
VRFVVFVEGETEKGAVVGFLKRWLDARLAKPVGVAPVFSRGCDDYLDSIKAKVERQFAARGRGELLAAIGLLDLYGLKIYPPGVETIGDRYTWAKRHIEAKVAHPKFTQHFAVHESEAWLLGDPSTLPASVRRALPGASAKPETVNFNEPPAKLLERLYREKERRRYKKTTDSINLFMDASPERVLGYLAHPFRSLFQMSPPCAAHGVGRVLLGHVVRGTRLPTLDKTEDWTHRGRRGLAEERKLLAQWTVGGRRRYGRGHRSGDGLRQRGGDKLLHVPHLIDEAIARDVRPGEHAGAEVTDEDLRRRRVALARV